MQTIYIRALRGFCFEGKRVEPGERIAVPASEALYVVGTSRAAFETEDGKAEACKATQDEAGRVGKAAKVGRQSPWSF